MIVTSTTKVIGMQCLKSLGVRIVYIEEKSLSLTVGTGAISMILLCIIVQMQKGEPINRSDDCL